ncbi:Putative esterase [Nonlabens sp. Hel1_33_55]|uniref:alpha/beta hydrolase n=1 Tax=Nonlabens sp. Hel1_33_55 TaxID=1336802 RepID=UPI000875DF1B|nr:alpha/beta hydrolase-fold protein [Nonlabens sp. Hel1_33_55]SCY11984.1 Putative esterase [Nonlabens sp. Hel1_33_55]
MNIYQMNHLALAKNLMVVIGLLAIYSCKDRSPQNVFEPNPVIAVNDQVIANPIYNDSIIYYNDFKSSYVDQRNVEVWLPAGYPKKDVSYQVLYMHDGQNVFNKETSSYGTSWEIDEKMDSLLTAGAISPTIVVNSWNTGKKRFSEYMPQMPDDAVESAFAKAQLKENTGYDRLYSDDYLKFMTAELKPFIDQNYQTSTLREDTFVMGASMGGLISMYALMEYPEIFGGAGCLSTHFPIPVLGEAMMQDIPNRIPDPKTHKFYFDYGTLTLDAAYEPHQNRVDQMFKEAGYNQSNYRSIKFEGHEHSEKFWNQRVATPLVFLLK